MLNIVFKNFIRSKSLVVGWLFLVLAGCIGLYTGNQFLQQQRKNITQTIDFQHESIERNVRYSNGEMGLLLYYLRFALVNETPNLTALSIGQRDVNPSIQSVTIRNLEAQKYDTDLVNPMHLLLGNLDLGFVLIYLFPLIIIAFSYNLLSEEREGGTWALVLSQTGSARRLLWLKFLVRFGSILTAWILLMLTAFFALQLAPDAAFLGVLALGFLHISFWFSMTWLVISFQKNSSFNAQILLSAWVLLTIIAPAMVNNVLAARFPAPEALATTVAQRDGYHRKWDTDKAETMEKFYTHYPQFRVFPLPDTQFSWLWYYAMQQMGDDEAHHEATDLKAKLAQREQASNRIAAFFPTLHTQLTINDLCESNLKNHSRFLDSLTHFHEQKRLYFYPKIFSEASMKNENWADFKVAYFNEKNEVEWRNLVTPFLIYTLIFSALAALRLRRI